MSFVGMLRLLESVVEALLVMLCLSTVGLAMVNWLFPSRLMFCQVAAVVDWSFYRS